MCVWRAFARHMVGLRCRETVLLHDVARACKCDVRPLPLIKKMVDTPALLPHPVTRGGSAPNWPSRLHSLSGTRWWFALAFSGAPRVDPATRATAHVVDDRQVCPFFFFYVGSAFFCVGIVL